MWAFITLTDPHYTGERRKRGKQPFNMTYPVKNRANWPTFIEIKSIEEFLKR